MQNNNSKKKQNSNTKPKVKRKRNGTRDKYKYWISAEGLTLLEGWAREGLTDEEIAGKAGIAASTLYEWKNKYPEIKEVLKNGKEVVDFQVEQALLKRALGMSVKVKKPIRLKDGEWSEKVEYVDEEQYYPPDTTAQIFWLKNRRRDRWTNSDKVEISTSKETSDILKGISEQFAKRTAEVINGGIDTLDES